MLSSFTRGAKDSFSRKMEQLTSHTDLMSQKFKKVKIYYFWVSIFFGWVIEECGDFALPINE
jgi:hypothetical protein